MNTNITTAILAAEGDVFVDDADGIGSWLEGNLRTVGLLMIIGVLITVAFSVLKGQRGGIFRNVGIGIVVLALLTNLGLLLDAGDLAGDLMQRVLNTFS